MAGDEGGGFDNEGGGLGNESGSCGCGCKIDKKGVSFGNGGKGGGLGSDLF